MSNFINSSLCEFKAEIKSIFEKKMFFAVLCALALVIGIILGITIKPTPFIFNYYLTNSENYYAIVMYASSGCFNIFLERIIVNLGYFAVFFAIGMLPALFPINLVFICYRGFVLSLTITVFSANFGMTGVLIACFLILPQNLITTVCLICVSVMVQKRKKSKDFIKKFALHVFLLYLISLVGALIEVLILWLILRPMNFYF